VRGLASELGMVTIYEYSPMRGEKDRRRAHPIGGMGEAAAAHCG